MASMIADYVCDDNKPICKSSMPLLSKYQKDYLLEVFSGFINTNIISADDAAAIMFRYYQSQNTAGLSIEHVIRQALADGDHIKALVYLIIVCKANASEALKYLEGIKLYSM